MESYDKLLEEAYKKVKVVETGSDRFEVPKVQGMVEGKNTIITNISAIADYLRRDVTQLTKYLLAQLATSGKVDSNRLILNTKVPSDKVNEKILSYTKEFVICNECKKPDTEITSEKGIKYKHCLACGAKSPVRSNI
jgi:translation initiation factor 2 subunit 2